MAKVLSVIETIVQYARKRGETVFLDQLVQSNRPITYGILKPGTGYSGGIPVIKVKDYPNGKVELENLLLTSPAIESGYKRSRLQMGDLLISIRGTVGRLAFVPEALNGANITQDTARLSLISVVNHQYIRFLMESSYVQRQIRSRITGMAVQGINIGELKKIRLPLIPRQDQDSVAVQLLRIQQATSLLNDRQGKTKRLYAYFLSNALLGGSE